MNKLIRAEFYRSTRSGIYFPIFVIFGLVPLILPFILQDEVPENNLFFYYLTNYSNGSGFMISGYMGIIMAVMLGNMYQNRTFYYEIMDGADTHHIILSKLAVYNTFSAAVLIIPAILVFTAVGIQEGTDIIEKPWLTAVLGAVIILNFTCVNVFISMLVRHMISGAILTYAYSMGISMSYMIACDEALGNPSEAKERFFSIFPQVQIMKLAQPEYSTDFIISVVVGFIVTFALLYALTYMSYKRKNFR